MRGCQRSSIQYIYPESPENKLSKTQLFLYTLLVLLTIMYGVIGDEEDKTSSHHIQNRIKDSERYTLAFRTYSLKGLSHEKLDKASAYFDENPRVNFFKGMPTNWFEPTSFQETRHILSLQYCWVCYWEQIKYDPIVFYLSESNETNWHLYRSFFCTKIYNTNPFHNTHRNGGTLLLNRIPSIANKTKIKWMRCSRLWMRCSRVWMRCSRVMYEM